MKTLRGLAVLLLLAAGCAVGPDYKAPAPPVSENFAAVDAVNTLPVPPQARWWAAFGDPTLDSLMARAASGNRDLAAAKARLAQARALRRAASGGFFPEGGPQADYKRVRLNQTTGSGAAASASGGAFDRTFDTYQAGFDASWEIDVFGGVRRTVQAAGAEAEAAEAALDDVLTSIHAEVARNYAEMRWAEERLAIARQDVAARQDSAAINRARFSAGLIPEVEALRAEAELDSARARIPALEQEDKAAMHRLAVLVGAPPADVAPELARTQAPGPLVDKALPAPLVLPSELARRRPDVRAAERRLEAATARVGVAVADLFPRFSITGSYAREAKTIGDLSSDAAEGYSIGPSVRWNILNLQRLLAGVDAAKAARDESLARYEQTVLTSLREVEDSLTGLDSERRRSDQLAAAARSSEQAASLAQARYAGGLTTFLEVTDAQSALLAAKDNLAVSRRNAAVNYIALVKALGGASPAQ